MLQEARPHPKITYQQGAGEDLPLPDKSVDVVTFAGSLFYAKSPLLIKELQRVCRNDAVIIPYDFEVLVADTLLQCGLKPEAVESDYDHEINFSGHAEFIELMQGKELINLEVTPVELAHILLASADSYEAFVEKYEGADPFPILVRGLESTQDQHNLKVNIYFSKYRLNTE